MLACQEAPYGFATQGVEKLQHFWGDVNLSDYAKLEKHTDTASKTSKVSRSAASFTLRASHGLL